MSAHLGAEMRRRWPGLAGAAAVMAFPIALIAATWQPLEPVPRAARPAQADDAATPERFREERRGRRQDGPAAAASPPAQDRRQDAAPAIATPRP